MTVIHVSISDNLHAELKKASVKNRIPMSAVTRTATAIGLDLIEKDNILKYKDFLLKEKNSQYCERL